MKIRNVNCLPAMLASNEITKEEGINSIAEFVCENYPIFGLHKFDEDFRSEVFINILEKGDKLIEHYKPENGDFFTYLFCFIKSLVKATLKSRAKAILNEKLSLQQSIENYQNYISNYENDLTQSLKVPKVPYAYKTPTLEELQKGLKANKLENCDKSLLILAAKASFFLSDYQILAICKLYGIEKNLFYDIIQYFREEVFPKKERLSQEIEKRNFKYYLHKKYNAQISYLNSQDQPNSEFKKLDLAKRDDFQIHNFNSMNKKFDEGHLYLRPSTKVVANVFGICDRQINYYLHCLKKGKIDPDIIRRLEDISNEDIVS